MSEQWTKKSLASVSVRGQQVVVGRQASWIMRAGLGDVIEGSTKSSQVYYYNSLFLRVSPATMSSCSCRSRNARLVRVSTPHFAALGSHWPSAAAQRYPSTVLPRPPSSGTFHHATAPPPPRRRSDYGTPAHSLFIFLMSSDSMDPRRDLSENDQHLTYPEP